MKSTLVFVILHGILVLVGILAMFYFNEVMFMFVIVLGAYKVFEYSFEYRSERRNA